MAGVKKIYTSENQYLYDTARENNLFREEDYLSNKNAGTELEYLSAMIDTKGNISSSFDKALYDRLSGADRFNYFVVENYSDHSSDEYKANVEYFKQKEQEIKNQEIYDGLTGLQKFGHTVGGLFDNALLQVHGLIENLIDAVPAAVGQIAGALGAEDVFESTKKFVAKDTTGYSAAQKEMNNWLSAYTILDKNWFGETLNNLTVTITRQLPTILGGAALTLIGGPVGTALSAVGTGIHYGAMYGASAEESYVANADIDAWSALKYSAGSVGLEAVTEWGSNVLFGASWFDPVTGAAGKTVASFGKDIWHDMWTEALEESVAELFGSMLYKKYVDPTADTASITDILYAAFLGAASGGILSAAGGIAGTSKKSVYQGQIVDTSSLTTEQKKQANNLGFSKSYKLSKLSQLAGESLSQTTEVTKLQAKYPKLSLDQIKQQFPDQYADAVEQDTATTENQTKQVLALAQFLNAIGEDSFRKAIDVLNENATAAREMVDNYLNSTDLFNKAAATAFKTAFPDESYTPVKIPDNAEQELAKTLRMAFPNINVSFGVLGQKDGLAVKSVKSSGNWLFIESGLVSKKGYDYVLGQSIRQELANDVLTQLSELEPYIVDGLVSLITDEKTTYKDLPEEQKKTLAQLLCFDPVANRRALLNNKKLHNKIFKSITNQAEYVRRFGRQTKANKLRYHDMLVIRDMFLKSVAETIFNDTDVATVKNEYGLTDEELTTKITDKTVRTFLNENTRLTNINFAKQAILRTDATQEIMVNRLDEQGYMNFDWSRLYDKTYYKPEFIKTVTTTEQNSDFAASLQQYLLVKYKTQFDLTLKDAILSFIKDKVNDADFNKLAEILFTQEFIQSVSKTVLQEELAETLYRLSQTESVDQNTDSIVIADNQIQGTGKLNIIKGEIDGRVYLSEERQRYLGESSDREIRWMEESATPTKYGDVTLTEISVLPEFYANKKDEYQRKYNIRVGFYIGDVTYHSNIDGDITLYNATGYTDQNKVLLKIDNVTEQELDITMFHEHLHNLIAKHKNLLSPFAEKVKKQIGTDEWNRLLKDLKDDDMYGKIDTDNDVLTEELVVKMATHYIMLVKTDSELTHIFEEFYNTISKKGKAVVDLSSNQRVSQDSKGRPLSKYQRDYFEKSVVRDENGNLLVMYHGTPTKGFTIFNVYGSNYGLFGIGSYFTENKSVGESYTEKGKGKNKGVYEVYLNITNPIDMDAIGELSDWVKAAPEAKEYFPQQGTNEEFFRALEEYMRDEHMTTDDASDYAMTVLMEMGYDGITHIGGGRFSGGDVRHRVYIAFYPEQIKNVDNKFPTSSGDIRFSLKQQNKQETSMQQKINKAESPKQIADVITAIIEAAPLEMSETKGYGDEGTRMYKKTSDEMRRKYASLWTKITPENYDNVRNELVKSDYEYADEALLIFDRFTRAYAGNSTKFDEATKKKIMEVSSRKQTIAAISQGLQSAELANEHSFGETAAAFEKDGYKVTVSNDTVKEYVPEMANKKEFIKEIDKEISNIEEQIKTAETDIDAAELNNQLDKAVEKRIVMSEGTNEEIMDWVIKNEDVVTKASKLQKEVFEQMVEKGELAQKEGKKAVTILVDEKTGLPKPFPKATQWIEKNVKRLKSFRMWAMLTSPVSWVRNWVGNAGMTALDSMTNSLEKFITSKQKVMSQQELAKLEKQHQELSRKENLTDTEKSKLAQLSNQIARNYDFKFVETKASKDLRKQIADDYKDVIQQILNGEDVKYESSAEKAAAITRAERKITRASQNANLGQKLWAACQSMTDWGLNTGWFGDNAVVVNSLVKNFANMVESNKTYLIKSLTTEYGKDGRGMSAERKALVEKALKTKDSMDIVNAMSKHDVDLFMDSCKQRTFEQYFKNSNWLSQWASNLSKKHPIAASLTSLVLPFPKVAANILSMAYKYSPLGFLSAARQWSVVKQMDAAGYEGVRDAFARAKAGRTTAQATVGSFMMLAGLILASLGFIDIDDDDYLGPSLNVGDWKVSLSNLAPSMTTFSVGAAMLWAWKNDKSATLKALDVLYDNTLLGNIENIFRYGDPSKYIENLSINYFSQYVPAMLKLFTKFTTNQEMIDKSGSYFAKLGKTFASGIPGVANLLPKKINPYTGETLTGTGTSNVFFNFIEALSPLDMRYNTKSATQKEAERLQTTSTGLSGKFSVNDKEYVVDKVTYSKYRANYIQTQFEQILSGKQKVTVEDGNGKRITTTYEKLNDKQKKNVINRLYTEATSMTKIKWWTDQGNTYVVTDKDTYNEYRKMFNNIIYRKNWSKSKFVES